MVLGVKSGGGVVSVLMRRFRKVVEEECVTLMSCCPSMVLEKGFGEGGEGDGEGVVRRLSARSLSSRGVEES
jgi:hypothetical protein